MTFNGKVYAITGGASGIGLATAKQILSRGGTVSIADNDASALAAAGAYFTGENASYLATKVDVSNRDEVEAWIRSTLHKYSRLDGAANVAGVIGKDHGIRPVAALDDGEWEKILAVNLTGCMYCLRAELNAINDGGSIVNVASIHATTGMPNHGAYAASKHGVLGLTRAAAKENGAREVRVNAVAPGAIYTPMMQAYWDEVGRPADATFDDPSAFRRQGTADEVASVILFLLGPFVAKIVVQVHGNRINCSIFANSYGRSMELRRDALGHRFSTATIPR